MMLKVAYFDQPTGQHQTSLVKTKKPVAYHTQIAYSSQSAEFEKRMFAEVLFKNKKGQHHSKAQTFQSQI
jgi:hypothetical protein